MLYFKPGTVLFVRQSEISWEVIESNEEHTKIKRLDTGEVAIVSTFNLKVYIYSKKIKVM